MLVIRLALDYRERFPLQALERELRARPGQEAWVDHTLFVARGRA
jgi:hypothetical protein